MFTIINAARIFTVTSELVLPTRAIGDKIFFDRRNNLVQLFGLRWTRPGKSEEIILQLRLGVQISTPYRVGPIFRNREIIFRNVKEKHQSLLDRRGSTPPSKLKIIKILSSCTTKLLSRVTSTLLSHYRGPWSPTANTIKIPIGGSSLCIHWRSRPRYPANDEPRLWKLLPYNQLGNCTKHYVSPLGIPTFRLLSHNRPAIYFSIFY